jgi:TetR/AcrR family transcriptional regulator, mexJK operon transcriptional repressor
MAVETVATDTIQKNNPIDEKMDAIVEAARITFLARGYDAASMDQIALTAGVSKRTVYNRFRSKEELFGAAIEDTCRNLVPVNLAEIEDSLPPQELIRQLSQQFVEGILEPEALALRRIATFEAQRSPEIGQSYLVHGPQWMVDHCSPILERLAAKGFLRLENPRAALWQLGALITEPLYSHVLLGAAPSDLNSAIRSQVHSGVVAFMKLYGA